MWQWKDCAQRANLGPGRKSKSKAMGRNGQFHVAGDQSHDAVVFRSKSGRPGINFVNIRLRSKPTDGIRGTPSRAVWQAGLFESLGACSASNVVTQQKERV